MADKEFKQLMELVDKVAPPNDIFAQPIPIEDHSTHYPYVPTHLQKVGAKVTGQQGEERFQFWPERMVRSAFSLPVDMYYGNTDEQPVKWEPNWLGEKLGLKGVVEAPGSGSALARSFDAAGLGMTGVLGPAKAGIVGSGIRPKAIAPMVEETVKAPMFYSAIEKALSGSKQNTASAEQWLGYLKNQPGVKAEELATLKLDELPKGQLTRQQVEEYIKGNKPELVENWKGKYEPEKLNESEYYKELEKLSLERYRIPYDHLSDSLQAKLRQEAMSKQNIIPTKYEKWQLPGGKNYRELVVSLPNRKLTELENLYKKDNLTEAESKRIVELRNEYKSEAYKSSHWDEPNPLYHVRMNDRMIDGKKSLHIEEIQSDWHQAGRKVGYKGDGTIAKRQAEIEKRLDEIRDSAPEGLTSIQKLELAETNPEYIRLRDELFANQKAEFAEKKAVPNAPFKKSWDELAFKRAIREAVENGYDQISWTPGEAQAARYDLSKHVNAIDHIKNKDGTYDLLIKPKEGGQIEKLKLTEKELENTVGKEVAEKIVKGEGEKSPASEMKMLSGLDLKVGGEGMKGFYDKMLVDKANALAKKYGVKVERKEINKKYRYDDNRDKYIDEDGNEYKSVDEAKQPVWSLKLTPEMKKDVMEKGFPLFSSGLPTLTPVDIDPFKSKVKLTPVDFDPFAPDKV